MKSKQIFKIVVDIWMTVVLVSLMAYILVGEEAHKWLGFGMSVLFILHYILNCSRSRNQQKEKSRLLRILQTVLVFLSFGAMLVSMVSGIMMAYVSLDFLPVTFGRLMMRTMHMLSAYWGMVFVSLHLGFHWNATMEMAGGIYGRQSNLWVWTARGVGILIAGYGIYAFFKRKVWKYLFLRYLFVYYDWSEPLIFFLLDYIAVMGLFVLIGHYLAEGLRRRGADKKEVSGIK